MKKLFGFFSVCAIAAAAVSCSSSDIKGYEKNDNGLYYKFYSQSDNSTPQPKENDEIHFKFVLKIKSNDSVLTDSRKERKDAIRMMGLRPSSFKGSLEEGIMMMRKGDSASFIVNADSFFLKTQQMQKLPPFIKPGDKLVADIKLVEIIDAKKAAELDEKRRAEMMAQMQEMEMASKQELAKYIEDNKVKAKPSETGLYYIELKKGKGPKIKNTDIVKVYYKGMLLNGQVFNDNTNDPEPIEFPLQQVIPAWTEGIAMMNVGGKGKLIVPYNLAYGPNGTPDGAIPPFANLIFEVEVLEAKPAVQ